MTVAGHEQAAAAESQLAEAHAAEFDPQAQAGGMSCDDASRSPAGLPACWTDTINPTEEHRLQAEKHRELAARHRAASQALKDAEALTCTGISEQDRDMSPFFHHKDIQKVTELKGPVSAQSGKAQLQRTVGASVVIRAVPGLTQEWLQRIVNCHLARNAAAGGEMPELPACPLVPRGARASVKSVGDGFAVNITAEDSATAQEIWRRAQIL
jgi:hypothetical protein